MLDELIKSKLRDPGYLDWHLAAARSINTIGLSNWYDAGFHRRYETARHFLGLVNPAALGSFIKAFDRLKPPENFQVALLHDLFDSSTRARILEVSRSIRADDYESSERGFWEARQFGRRVVWDHPFFLELQRDLLPRASAVAGCELTVGYNFLSLYGGKGNCSVHMDRPDSMYTLDYCIEQSDEWPIHFSKVVEWPDIETIKTFDPDAIKADPELDFSAHILKPNQALLFNGSSQWHYRDPITPGGFCDLLFFHYFPAGCEDLVDPLRWATHFGIPELAALCDLFEREDPAVTG